MAKTSSWIPHVEAFVHVSRSPAQHAASLEALAALVKKDHLTLFALVKEMEMYLTTTDHIVRSRGILLLAEILSRISSKPLDSSTIATLGDFFISRLSDWQALRGALVGCLALLCRKGSAGTIMISDVKRLAESFLTNIQVQSLAATDRKLCFEVLNCIVDHFPEAVKTLGDDLLYGICEAIDEEKDPKCLKLSFHLVEVVMQLFPDPSGLAAHFAGEVFEILSKYFPVYFTHGGGDDLGISRDDLSWALMHAFCSTPYFEPFAISLLLDKLSSSLPLAKLDSLKYLNNCIRYYGADRMVKHATAIWCNLKEVIFNLSPDQLLSTSGSPKDAEKDKNQIATEALNCLKTAIMYITSSDKDLFVNLILLDEDILNKVHSIVSGESSIGSSLQSQGQLNALGSVISILAESSTYFCTRVFQAHFARLMDILGASAGCECNRSNICNGSFSSANYGALYLSVKILSSCKEVALATQDYSPVKSAHETWRHILEKFLDPLIHVLGSLLAMNSQGVQSEARQEYISCAAKGLQVLATFPEQCSPVSEDAYRDILLMLTSVITSKYEDAYLWKLSLKMLAQIGSSVAEFHASGKGMIYSRTVVDKIISFVQLNDTLMPLTLRLDASFEIGTAALDYMLRVARALEEAIVTNISKACVDGRTEHAEHVVHLLECYSNRVLPWLFTSGGINELAMQFAIRVWNEIENLTILINRIKSQDLLNSLMMAMKLLIGVCTEEHQSLIVQKAYDIVSSMSSLPVKSMTQSLSNIDEIVTSDSIEDTNLVSLLASVVVGLRPQTPIPDISVILNLFTIFLLKGHVPAAHALASIINKWPGNINASELSNEHKLDKALEVILEKCFSTVLSSSNLKTCYSSNHSVDDASCSDNSADSITLKIEIVSGLAWIGKGMLMRGDEKVKDITMFLLKCLLSSQNVASIPSHQEEYDSNAASEACSLLATSAADAFHVIMSDSDVCLNKKFHARIKPLYKQRFFSILTPIVLSKIKESVIMRTKVVLYRAFGHIISNAPLAAVITEAHQIILVLVGSLATLSLDIQNKDLVYSLLLVLSGILMDDNGKECIVENIHIVIGVLTQLVFYPHMMLVRETAIQCLVAMSSLPHSKIYPMRPQVLQAAIKALDDKKRAVRQEAVRCRQAWIPEIDSVGWMLPSE